VQAFYFLTSSWYEGFHCRGVLYNGNWLNIRSTINFFDSPLIRFTRQRDNDNTSLLGQSHEQKRDLVLLRQPTSLRVWK
jgi:hypothetical protein